MYTSPPPPPPPLAKTMLTVRSPTHLGYGSGGKNFLKCFERFMLSPIFKLLTVKNCKVFLTQMAMFVEYNQPFPLLRYIWGDKNANASKSWLPSGNLTCVRQVRPTFACIRLLFLADCSLVGGGLLIGLENQML